MTGHEQIIAARLHREKPSAIIFELRKPDPLPQPWKHVLHHLRDMYRPEGAMACKLTPVVFIEAEELTKPIDLRFVVGCSVHVLGQRWTPQLIDLGNRIADAGAGRVFVSAIAECGDLRIFNDGEWRNDLA